MKRGLSELALARDMLEIVMKDVQEERYSGET